jgi:N-acetylneuraminic acid mutarotase
VEKYDPATDKWTKKTDMPTARYGLSTGVVGRKIYAIGGEKVIAGKIVPFPTIEEYDPATDKWTKKTDMPTARYGLSTSVVGGKIYAIGGFDKDARSLSTMEEYDPVIDKWTKKTDMPTPRSDLSTSVMNGKIYAIGGTQVWPAKGLSTVEEYDIGFADEAEGIEAKEKLVTSWGKIKVKY